MDYSNFSMHPDGHDGNKMKKFINITCATLTVLMFGLIAAGVCAGIFMVGWAIAEYGILQVLWSAFLGIAFIVSYFALLLLIMFITLAILERGQNVLSKWMHGENAYQEYEIAADDLKYLFRLIFRR